MNVEPGSHSASFIRKPTSRLGHFGFNIRSDADARLLLPPKNVDGLYMPSLLTNTNHEYTFLDVFSMTPSQPPLRQVGVVDSLQCPASMESFRLVGAGMCFRTMI
jgi:hypothetical protein